MLLSPAAVALCVTLHEEPSQCSARTRCCCPEMCIPRAQASLEATETTARSQLCLPTLGLGMIDQAVPSQCIVMVWLVVPLNRAPTAHTSVGEYPEIP